MAMNYLAQTLDRLGRSDESEALFRRTLSGREETLGKHHPVWRAEAASEASRPRPAPRVFPPPSNLSLRRRAHSALLPAASGHHHHSQ